MTVSRSSVRMILAAVAVVLCFILYRDLTEPPRPSVPFHEAARRGIADQVYRNIYWGRSVHSRDMNGETAVHLAARGGFHNVIDILLGEGTDINARDNWGMAPLHWASWIGQEATVESLLRNGADPHARNSTGRTPLAVAIEHERAGIARIIRRYRAAH